MGVAVRRTGKQIGSVSSWDGLTRLAVLAVCFAVGALGGFLFSALGVESPELTDYLRQYFQSAGQGGGLEPSLGATIWDLIRWPLAAFLLGLAPIGAAGVPLLMGGRGFLLAFAATTFARLFHLPGVAAALAAFGVTVLLAVPVLFVVAEDAFRQSLSRLPGAASPPVHWSDRARALAPCAGLLVLAVALQQTVMPALFSAVCARLLIS
jgi:hypothetical protein